MLAAWRAGQKQESLLYGQPYAPGVAFACLGLFGDVLCNRYRGSLKIKNSLKPLMNKPLLASSGTALKLDLPASSVKHGTLRLESKNEHPDDGLIEFVEVLQGIQTEGVEARLNETSISDNNGGRILL